MKKFVLSTLLFALIFFSTAEIGTRFILSSQTLFSWEMIKYAHELKIYKKDASYGFTHQPNKSLKLMGVEVSTNSLGLRDDEVDDTKIIDAAFLGDSLTFGWGVPQDQIFPKLVDEGLGEKNQIWNFGHCNFNTEQELLLFKTFLSKYHFKEVFLFYFINDAEPTNFSQSVPFWSYSPFLSLLVSRWKSLFSFSDSSSYYTHIYKTSGWEKAQKSILELKTLVEDQKGVFKVFLLPHFYQLNPYPFEEQHHLIRDFLSENNINHFDFLDVFKDTTNSQDLWVARDDPHPNSLAHKKIAEVLLDHWREQQHEPAQNQ